MSRTTFSGLQSIVDAAPDNGAILSYAFYRMRGPARIYLERSDIKNILATTSLPTPQTQLDNFVLWLGDSSAKGFGHLCSFQFRTLKPIVGASNNGTASYLVDEIVQQKLANMQPAPTGCDSGLMLSFTGWRRYNDLRRTAIDSKQAFMAMDFNNPAIDEILLYFKRACELAGFALTKCNEGLPAGLIDNHMRARIRTARFVVSDLTGRNPGAYWEAGFAEGLDRKVIYSCEASEFQNLKTHFDTNHSTTIPWSLTDPELAAKTLANTIRATFPDALAELPGESFAIIV